MKQLTFLILVMYNLPASQAQPIITTATIPAPGDGQYIQYCSSDGIEPGDSGANIVWDFSTADTWGLDINWFYDFNGTGDYPNANLTSNSEHYMFFIGPSHFDEYYEKDDVTLWYHGNAPDSLAEGFYSTDPLKLLEYPFTYGSYFIDSFSFYYYNWSWAIQHGVDTFLADGYGTVITPVGVFEDAVRTKTISTWYYLNNSTYFKVREENYCWFVPYCKFPVFTINREYGYSPVYDADSNIIDFLIFPAFWQDVYYNSNLVYVSSGFNSSSSDASISIYPNPVLHQATIQFTLAVSSQVNIKVYDVSGKEMKTIVNDELQEGRHSLQLNTNDFTKGIYFVRMISENRIQNIKLIVQ